MSGIWTMGEILVEIMRPEKGLGHYKVGSYMGPYPSGAPAIFIDTVARLGYPAGIIGGVGDDEFGRCVLDRLILDGVDCRLVQRCLEGSTAVAFVAYETDGSRQFIFHIKNTPAVVIETPDLDGLLEPDFFHIMGCSLAIDPVFCANILDTMTNFRSMGARISFDPNIRTELLRRENLDQLIRPVLEQCSILMPGEEELLHISGMETTEQAIEKLFRNDQLEMIVIKKGKRGCTVQTRSSQLLFGVYDVESIDPTGAGDSFDGAFLTGLAKKQDLPVCVQLATAAASLNTATFGPMEGNISMQNLKRLMSQPTV